MNQGIISARYAKALMMAGAEQNCLDRLKEDMELLGEIIRDNPPFRQMLNIPIIKPPQKRRMMTELLEQRVHPLTLNFINLMIYNRRETLLADAARNFINRYEHSKGIQRAHLISAAELSSQSEQQLQQQLNTLFKTGIQLSTETSPELIGGFILRIGGLQYDASLHSALARMRKRLVDEC
jgi:F-type H+-transporting ATPase subunit delta